MLLASLKLHARTKYVRIFDYFLTEITNIVIILKGAELGYVEFFIFKRVLFSLNLEDWNILILEFIVFKLLFKLFFNFCINLFFMSYLLFFIRFRLEKEFFNIFEPIFWYLDSVSSKWTLYIIVLERRCEISLKYHFIFDTC